MLTIATWNVNSINVRLSHVLKWLDEQSVDVLALQETKSVDEKFPCEAFSDAGYQVTFTGQKSYNGVAVVSRYPISNVLTDNPFFIDPERRVLAATIEGIRVINIYVPNGRSLDSEKYTYKLNWLAKMRDFICDELNQYDKLVVLGDFNIAPEDRDVHSPKAWEGHILVSEPERQAFQALLDCGLNDLFRLFSQDSGCFSWWDYRGAGFRRDLGLRLDHILGSDALVKSAKACIIDKAPRSWERPSDHVPVMVALRA